MGTTMPSFGGSNQYSGYPVMSNRIATNTFEPFKPPATGPTGPSGAAPGGFVPPSGSLPFAGNGYPTTASKAGGFGLQGGAASVPTQDPYFSQEFGSMLGGQLGQGMTPYNLSGYLPSSNTYSAPGQVAAPLTNELEQLQRFYAGGTPSAPGQSTLAGINATGFGNQQTLAGLAQSGGLTGNLSNLYNTGAVGGSNLPGLTQTGGITGNLANLYNTGAIGGSSIPGLAQSGGLSGNLLEMYNTGAAPGSSLPGLGQTGGLTGNMASLASTGNPIDQTPAWQAMVKAENQNTALNEANLKEQFASMGNLSSSSAADAMSQYLQQTTLGQNAQLTAAQTAAMQQAVQNQLAAGTTGIGTQLSADQLLSGNIMGAGQFGVDTRMNAGQMLNNNALNTGQFGVGTQLQGNQLMSNNVMQAGGLGVGTELQAGTTGLNAQQQVANEFLQGGTSLGEYTQGLDQASIQNLMSEYFQTTPQENPLNQEMFGLATTYPSIYTKQGNVGEAVIGQAGSILQGAGSLGTAIGDAGGIGQFFSNIFG